MAYNKPPDDGKYIVQDGDWVGSIAMDFGYTDWKHDVRMRSENSDLRDKRPSPYILAPDDVLFIPPWEEKTESCATEQKHKFKLKAPTEILRIRLITPDGKPFKNEDYTLTLTWDPGGGKYEQQNKKTDADGILKETVPSTTTLGKLTLPNMKQTITLRFGFLTPMDPKKPELPQPRRQAAPPRHRFQPRHHRRHHEQQLFRRPQSLPTLLQRMERQNGLGHRCRPHRRHSFRQNPNGPHQVLRRLTQTPRAPPAWRYHGYSRSSHCQCQNR